MQPDRKRKIWEVRNYDSRIDIEEDSNTEGIASYTIIDDAHSYRLIGLTNDTYLRDHHKFQKALLPSHSLQNNLFDDLRTMYIE